jgi:uncharacterized membrane protein
MSGKQVKTERRGATRIEAVRPHLQSQPRWPLLAIRVLTALGFIVSAYLTVLHVRAGAGGVIDSPLCGAGAVINCNSVLGSAYARLFNTPVAGWAAATYGLTLFVSFFGPSALLVLLCGWAFAFSLYMGILSLFVVQAACLFCIMLYAINAGLVISALTLARSASLLTSQQAMFSAIGYTIVIAGFGWWQSQEAAVVTAVTEPIPAPAPTAVDEGFIKFYNSQKLVTLSGEERHTKGSAQALLTVSEFVDFR